MNDPTLTPDDPRLTAYALGELSGDERAHIEAAVRDDPVLRAIVDDIRATTTRLEAALAAEAAEDFEPGEACWSDAPPATINGHAPEPATRPKHKPVPPVPAAVNGHGAASFARQSEDDPDETAAQYRGPRRGARILRFPQLYVIFATAAAACFAIFVRLRDDELKTRQQAAETLARIAVKKRAHSEQIATATVASPTPQIAVSATSAAPPPAAPFPAAASDSADLAKSTASVLSETTPETDLSRNATPQVAATEPAPSPAPTSAFAVAAPSPEPAKPSDAAENKLALLEISRAEPATTAAAPTTLAQAAATAPLISNPPMTPVREVASVNPTVRASIDATNRTPTSAHRPETPASAGTARSAPFVAPKPGSSFAAAEPAASDEIVRLDTFEVSADRIGPFIASGALTSLTTLTRGIPEPEPLPRAPRGAHFGRAKEIAAFTGDNDFVRTSDNATSQLSVDVDTASYGLVKRLVELGVRPPPGTVRIEELLNYFPYDYAAPTSDQAFAAALEVAAAPWAPEHRLVRVGLKAREVALAQRGPANLVLLLDVSSSMGEAGKLPRVRDALRQLLPQLRPDDRIAIVTYAADAKVALPSTPVSHANEILAALAALRPAGPSEAGAGLQLAYRVAIGNFVRNGANRVLFCTDGAFNPGSASERELLGLIDEKTRSGIALTVLGFGGVNDHSTILERLVQKAGVTYGYVDSSREAERQLVENVCRSIATIARDVRVQVDFNPAKVLAYRLIGYENRPLRREDFSDDAPVTGEVGAGQALTALYEVVPALPQDLEAAAAAVAARVHYSASGAVSSRLELPDAPKPPGNELLTVSVRYKNPNTFLGWARTQQFALADAGTAFADASADFRFAAAVAEFGMILRGSPHRGGSSLRDVVAWANSAAGPGHDAHGYRRDFVTLARKAGTLFR